jgi:predicted CXXCH cytochrome family protein
MLRTLQNKKQSKPMALTLMAGACVAGALIAGTAQYADAGFNLNTRSLQATGPCLFSEQLQSTPQVRREYIAKLVAVVGDASALTKAGNPIEQMYGNIKPASFKGDDYDEPSGRNIWGFDTEQVPRSPGIDSLSSDCLNCHDGVAALPVSVVLRNSPFNKRHSPGSDHPIGMDYNMYAASSSEYKPLMLGSNKMVFVNGKVGCLTCHNPLNPEKGHLVMSDQKSALCLTCHNK